MSSVISKKKKTVYQFGWLDDETKELERLAAEKKIREAYIKRAYDRFRDVTFFVLHDKYGFGKKRLERFQKDMYVFFEEYEKQPNSMILVAQIASEKCGFDIVECGKAVPWKEKLLWAADKKIMTDKVKLQKVLICYDSAFASMYAPAIYTLQTVFKFSRPKLKEFLEWQQYYMNSYARGGLLSALDLEELPAVLEEETGFKIGA